MQGAEPDFPVQFGGAPVVKSEAGNGERTGKSGPAFHDEPPVCQFLTVEHGFFAPSPVQMRQTFQVCGHLPCCGMERAQCYLSGTAVGDFAPAVQKREPRQKLIEEFDFKRIFRFPQDDGQKVSVHGTGIVDQFCAAPSAGQIGFECAIPVEFSEKSGIFLIIVADAVRLGVTALTAVVRGRQIVDPVDCGTPVKMNGNTAADLKRIAHISSGQEKTRSPGVYFNAHFLFPLCVARRFVYGLSGYSFRSIFANRTAFGSLSSVNAA